MTELGRARAHLLHCQDMLECWRILSMRKGIRFLDVGWAEANVLAALSWVWEEQEKDRIDAAANPRLIIGAP